MPLLTVFTPTYNRSHTLNRTYKSLKKQTCKDFEWLVIDDGSTDNTKELVNDWIKEEKDFNIRYYYKDNGGLHTAYNIAIEHLNTQLAVCVDSDDYIPNNSVELIKNKWLKDGSNKYAGITGLDYDLNNRVIGNKYPNQYSINLIDVSIDRIRVNGDKKHVVRSELYKQVAPMRVFDGEKYFNPHYMHLEVSRNYDFLVLNENLCYVDYQRDGMTSNMFKQYYNSPNSFLELRKQFLTFKGGTIKKQIRNMIHLVSSSLLAGRYCSELSLSNKKILMLLCTIPGFILMIIIKIKGKQ